MPSLSMPEEVAEMVVDAITRLVDETSGAINQSGGVFTVHTTPAKELAFWKSQVLLPDGQPNYEGIRRVIQEAGPEAWDEIVRSMEQDWRRQQQGG